VQPEPELELELVEVEPEPGTAPIQVHAAVARVPPTPPRDAIELDLEVKASKPKTGPQPIADLLTSGDEGEIELLSISSDQEAAPPAPAAASVEELDAAFSNILDEHARKAPRKVPTRVPLFDELGRDAFVELVNKLDYRVYQPGDIILREGDPGRSFFVISEGRVRVYKTRTDGTELQLATLDEGAFFGEMAMLSGAPRTASIAAETETAVLEVTDKVVRQLVAKYPQVTATLKNFYRQRLVNNVMAISPLFKDFDSAERKSLIERFRMRQAKAGEVLVEQGKKSDGLYVVLHGAVNVSVNAKNGEVDLARLKEGDIFGEGSMLTREPATATVVAAVPSIVLKLPREQFQEMISTHPQVLALVSELTDKRRSATEAILKGQGPGVDGMAFV
jgi:CRP-like cAMP-binding protein